MQNHIKQWTCPLHTANAGDDGKKYYTQLFGLFQRPAGNKKKGVFHVYDLGVVSARKAGKPPPESGPRIRSSKALECLKCKDSAGKKTCLVSDGAPCYPKLARQCKVIHYSCNHSKGVFCVKKRRFDGSTLLVHTGSIDAMWRLSKEAIKSSWNTRVNGSVNPKLLQGVRVFQWRWHHSDKGDMMSVTGHALKKLRLSWNEKKRRAVGRVYPVKTNRSWKCTFKIPGIFDYLCDHKMATAPQRQPHSNWKIAQPLARFPPRRDVYDIDAFRCTTIYIYIYIYIYRWL